MAFEVDSSIYNLGDPIGNFYQGYQLAQIPKEIKKQNDINALNKSILENQAKYAPLQSEEELRSSQLKNEGASIQNAYAPQLSEEDLKNAKLRNAGLKTSNDIDSEKLARLKEDQRKKEIFTNYLLNGSGAQSSDQGAYQQQQASPQQQQQLAAQQQQYLSSAAQQQSQPQQQGYQSPQSVLMQAANQNMQQQNPYAINQMQQMQGDQQYPQRTVQGAGNPSNVSQILQRADQMWLSNDPGARQFLKEQGYEGSTKSYQYQGQVIDETTLPSGRKTYSVTRVTDPQEGTTVYDPSTGNPLVTLGGGGGMLNLPKPKAGEGYYYKTDDNGQVVLDNLGKPIPEGILRPYEPKEREETVGREMFSTLYPKVNDIQSYYSGKGSIEKYMADVKAVEENPEKNSEARERLIQLEEASKLIAPLSAKEIATLDASNTYGTFKVLSSKLQGTDLPKFFTNTYASFKVPSFVKKEAGDRFLDDLTQATNSANAKIGAYKKLPFNVSNDSIKKSEASNTKGDSGQFNWDNYDVVKY